MNRNNRGSRISREYQEYQIACKAKSDHEPLIQSEGGGDIVQNDPDLIYLSKNAVSIDMSVD